MRQSGGRAKDIIFILLLLQQLLCVLPTMSTTTSANRSQITKFLATPESFTGVNESQITTWSAFNEAFKKQFIAKHLEDVWWQELEGIQQSPFNQSMMLRFVYRSYSALSV
ncbi:hypothetical protein PHYBLDRAFT_149847 [Phycomyces blakesleeanus NRRL 1555(-)]|uniref:Uncharacterized protein n=1 Tax=Phycomyces blakesleeanus (strain ATCC 8743b / DSM 1359 / FGSC 10004 / NBRC 33097 / NRRL 1555) TaxID=763407 RepID=A0A167KTG0_PHYB8|nr:hypothetical protein PHYBLDRAFT_149847 [Phycomyces blakesleeanus NRRL 1555(-)]OAD68836.1 hypothetical protein PHYBLDRAFT_149847 [Phycomyces blakesleeanus NRRL 1555(-)]|eukprot:XP_018286876.1 hypothetical protein PHYBLDRAFT_149847 [Phycomyces blakesleeanus NRRL 1555(-)]